MTKTGRNAPCPCGSGRKYKNCCAGREAAEQRLASSVPAEAIADQVWQADILPFPASFEEEPHGRPTVVMVTANGLVLHTDILSTPLGEAPEIARRLARAVSAARLASGASPATVAIRWPDVAEELRGQCPESVRIAVRPVLNDLKDAARDLFTQVANFPYWPPVSHPDSWLAWGLPRPVIADLFDAAATFHNAKPWRLFEAVPPVEVVLPGGREWIIGVMGSGGLQFGLTMYADVDDYLATISKFDAGSLPEFHGPTIGLGFGSVTDLPRRSRREAASNGWRFAAPDAYPILAPMNTPAGGISRTDAADLILLLRAIPAFADAIEQTPTALNAGEPFVWTHHETGAV
ncbi:MAG: YecA family protein, partial [Longimicrobiales bacterium]